MKVTVTQPQPEPPPKIVTITLSEEEARGLLIDLNFSAPFHAHTVTGNITYELRRQVGF